MILSLLPAGSALCARRMAGFSLRPARGTFGAVLAAAGPVPARARRLLLRRGRRLRVAVGEERLQMAAFVLCGRLGRRILVDDGRLRARHRNGRGVLGSIVQTDLHRAGN